MNPAYRSLFVSRISSALNGARAADAVTHSGVKGTIREILVRDLFRPLLPYELGIGTGQIATRTGDLSPQQDVIIYNSHILPPVLFEKTTGIFPIESVLATIEVKTRLTADELRSAHRNARTIKALSYNYELPRIVKKAISVIFALDSDLDVGGKTELDRYLKLHPDDDPPVRAICVCGRGYWFYGDDWCFLPPDTEHQETIGFIIGLVKTFSEVGSTRWDANLIPYLMDNPPIVRGVAGEGKARSTDNPDSGI